MDMTSKYAAARQAATRLTTRHVSAIADRYLQWIEAQADEQQAVDSLMVASALSKDPDAVLAAAAMAYGEIPDVPDGPIVDQEDLVATIQATVDAATEGFVDQAAVSATVDAATADLVDQAGLVAAIDAATADLVDQAGLSAAIATATDGLVDQADLATATADLVDQTGLAAATDGLVDQAGLTAATDDLAADVASAYVPRTLLQVQEANDNAIIAGGVGNTVADVASRATDSKASHAEGYHNRALEWYAHVEGAGCIVDGKIAHAEGNAVICSANDSHAEGNRTVTGRRYYSAIYDGITTGSEDAGDGLGVRQYVLIPAASGDLTSYFPNPLTDVVTTRYGAGAQKDVKGNIYASGFTPAVWTGDTPTTPNDLRWAMHPVCILRGSEEEDIEFATVVKATYSGGTGTKIYYSGAQPFATITGIYTSYSPVVLNGGNGQHSEGYFTSTSGYGGHAEGWFTRAWGNGAHAEGYRATAEAEGSHAEGTSTRASGVSSHAEGSGTIALGVASHAAGLQSRAVRNYQQALASGRRVVDGDNQASRIVYTKQCVDAGWHNVTLLSALESNRSYWVEAMIFARQTAGSAGAVGHSFAYRASVALAVDGSGAFSILSYPAPTLVGRTTGMVGDGVTTGPRITAYGVAYPSSPNGDLIVRFDGLDSTTFQVTTHSTVLEIA